MIRVRKRNDETRTSMLAWRHEDNSFLPVLALVREKKLKVNLEDAEHYFEAEIDGETVTAPKTATVVFKNENEFFFVSEEEFMEAYLIEQVGL